MSAVEAYWEDLGLPALCKYIEQPALSTSYDPDWRSNGHLAAAAESLRDWCRDNLGAGEVVPDERPDGGPPCVLVEIPAAGGGGSGSTPPTVVIYGHYDKQPDSPGWLEGRAHDRPMRETDPATGDHLYGRGAADDGYALFAAAGAVLALRRLGRGHARVVIVLEGAEESGSPFFEPQLAALAGRVGEPELIVTLDSSCIDFERLWVSTSARGAVTGTLKVRVLEGGIHSGQAGGVVPSSFRVLRQLLSRIEREDSGDLPDFEVEIPLNRREQMRALVEERGEAVLRRAPVVEGLALEGLGTLARLERQTWRAALEVVGLGGAPPPEAAGNVLRPTTEARISIRLPPTFTAARAFEILEDAWVRRAPPYGAEVTFERGIGADGWHAPEPPAWLRHALRTASTEHFGNPEGYAGEGGSNPFLLALGSTFPRANQLALGLFGPGTNHHGPNERLDVTAAKRLTACLAEILAARAAGAGGTGST
jgi:acetylornithine deacetylase/succinyl-diaminopimelate desuccinylase-like protein